MAVKIRLSRRGRKKLAIYDLIVADARSPRDGRFIEKLGIYNPNSDPATIDFNEDRAFHWLMVGAQPTDTVRRILSYKGILYKKHLQVGVNKGAITQEEADKKLEKWVNEKSEAVQSKRDRLVKEALDAKKAKTAAEKKISDARAETIAKKNIVEEEPQVETATADTAAEEAPAVEEAPVAEATAEEAPAEEAKKEEAPKEEAKAEEAPAEEVPAEEAKAEEAPVEEAEEAPKAEAKSEEAPAEEKEEPKAEASEEEVKKAE